MIIKDHINLTGSSPLVGPNEEAWGIRFPDMSRVYDKNLALIAEEAGKNNEIYMQKGVYAGLKGPSLETPAEVRFLRINRSRSCWIFHCPRGNCRCTCRHEILGLATITNVHNPDNPVESNIEEIIAVAGESSLKLASIISNVIEKL